MLEENTRRLRTVLVCSVKIFTIVFCFFLERGLLSDIKDLSVQLFISFEILYLMIISFLNKSIILINSHFT